MKVQTARKDHYCDLCERKIPKGHRFWRHWEDDGHTPTVNRKEHTNCLEYEDQPKKGEE